MTIVYYEILRKTVAVESLKIASQVVNFSRYSMDLFFSQLRVAIRRMNIHSQRGFTFVQVAILRNRENDKLLNNFYIVIRYYYLLYNILPASYMHLLSGADVC